MAEFLKITNGEETKIPPGKINAAYRDATIEDVELVRREPDGKTYIWDFNATTAGGTLQGGWVESAPSTNGLAPAHFIADTLVVADP